MSGEHADSLATATRLNRPVIARHPRALLWLLLLVVVLVPRRVLAGDVTGERGRALSIPRPLLPLPPPPTLSSACGNGQSFSGRFFLENRRCRECVNIYTSLVIQLQSYFRATVKSGGCGNGN